MSAPGSTPTGPWRPSHAARPLLWWDDHGLERLKRALRDLLDQWSADWGIHCDGAKVHCQIAQAGVAPACRWLPLDADGVTKAWVGLPECGDADWMEALFPGAIAHGALSRAVAASCRQDAMARLSSLFGLSCGMGSEEPPLAALGRIGSGAVEAWLPAPADARLLMMPELAARWRVTPNHRLPGSRDALVVATAALAERPLELHVELEGCELDVGTLQDLQVGDVVRLAHGLDSPVCVRHAGAPLCHAYIGRRGNRKAVELAGRRLPASGDVAP